MSRRIRRLLFGPRREVLGGGRSTDSAPVAGAAAAGGIGAVSDRHRPSSLPDDDRGAQAPHHGDDELEPRVPPDR